MTDVIRRALSCSAHATGSPSSSVGLLRRPLLAALSDCSAGRQGREGRLSIPSLSSTLVLPGLRTFDTRFSVPAMRCVRSGHQPPGPLDRLAWHGDRTTRGRWCLVPSPGTFGAVLGGSVRKGTDQRSQHVARGQRVFDLPPRWPVIRAPKRPRGDPGPFRGSTVSVDGGWSVPGSSRRGRPAIRGVPVRSGLSARRRSVPSRCSAPARAGGSDCRRAVAP